MSKKIVSSVETIIYRGNCPSCGIEQDSYFEIYADSICQSCREINVIEKYKTDLIGSEIIGIDTQGCILDVLIIKINEKLYKLKSKDDVLVYKLIDK